MENVNSFYPQKPELEQPVPKKGHVAVTVFSVLLFALTFMLLFGQDYWFLFQILAVLLLHEGGHFIMMKLFGYENVRMLFVPLMGAFVHGTKKHYSQRQSLLVILAGPFPGIVLGVIFWLLGEQWNMAWMGELALMSFFLNVINLLPFQPLDGGKILQVLLFGRAELLQLILAFTASIGMIALGFFLEMYGVMIFGFLMGFQVRGMHRRYLIHKSLRKKDVDVEANYETLSNEHYFHIKEEVLEYTPNLQKFRDVAEEDEYAQIVGQEVKNILVTPVTPDLNILQKVVAALAWLAAILGPVYLILSSEFITNLYAF
jgi:stage IV sporulation protein FB